MTRADSQVIRGDVYLVRLKFEGRDDGEEPRAKYVVALQGGPDFEHLRDVAVVVASTLRKPGRLIRPFEVLVGAADGFEADTVIDCRWVRTIPKPEAPQSDFQFRLSPTVMNEVAVALTVGLQL